MIVLVGNIITSLLGALLISVVAVIVLLLIIHWLFPDYLAGSILFSAFLSIVLMAVIGVQAFLGLGASKVKEYVVSAEQSLMTVAQVIQQTKDPQERQTTIQNILEEEVPLGGRKLVKKYIDQLDVEQVSRQPEVLAAGIKSYLSGYIVRRWIWGIVVWLSVAAILGFKAYQEQQRMDRLRYRNMMNM